MNVPWAGVAPAFCCGELPAIFAPVGHGLLKNYAIFADHVATYNLKLNIQG